MKKAYADLHLCPDHKNPEQTLRLAQKAAKLGYHLIALTLPPTTTEKEIQQLRATCENAKIDMATRIDLKPRSPGELLDSLRKLRRRFEIIAVTCESKNVARQAAKDRRVDLLDFASLDFRGRFFDSAEAELATNGLAALEIDMKPLLTLEGSARIRLLSSLRREAATAIAHHISIIISSNAQNELLMRKPSELAALASLFDLNKSIATDAVSKNPITIVKRNREKLNSKFVVPGIRVVRRGKDC